MGHLDLLLYSLSLSLSYCFLCGLYCLVYSAATVFSADKQFAVLYPQVRFCWTANCQLYIVYWHRESVLLASDRQRREERGRERACAGHGWEATSPCVSGPRWPGRCSSSCTCMCTHGHQEADKEGTTGAPLVAPSQELPSLPCLRMFIYSSIHRQCGCERVRAPLIPPPWCCSQWPDYLA